MSTTSIASAISTPTYLCQSSLSSTIRKPTFYTLSTSINSISSIPIFRLSTWNHQLGLTPFSRWHGLRHLGVSISQHSVRLGKKRRRKGKGVFASLFGVGAPEALVIGVVALLVFGPKGLAEVARTLGKTLRAFQPTIKELQDVSREFKNTLEQEIGLDDIQSPMQNNSSSSTTTTNSSPSTIASSEDSQMKVDPSFLNSSLADFNECVKGLVDDSPSTSNAYSSEDYMKITEEQFKAAATQQQIQTASLGEIQSETTQTKSQDTVEEAEAVVLPSPRKPNSET